MPDEQPQSPIESPHPLEELQPHPLEEGYSILESRRGVYDFDEFDVFNRGENIDLTRVHIGKKLDLSTTDLLLFYFIDMNQFMIYYQIVHMLSTWSIKDWI